MHSPITPHFLLGMISVLVLFYGGPDLSQGKRKKCCVARAIQTTLAKIACTT